MTLPDLTDDLVTIPTACEKILGFSKEAGYQLVRRGEFPGDSAIRIGTKWRVSVPKLLRHLHGDEYQNALPKPPLAG